MNLHILLLYLIRTWVMLIYSSHEWVPFNRFKTIHITIYFHQPGKTLTSAVNDINHGLFGAKTSMDLQSEILL